MGEKEKKKGKKERRKEKKKKERKEKKKRKEKRERRKEGKKGKMEEPETNLCTEQEEVSEYQVKGTTKKRIRIVFTFMVTWDTAISSRPTK